MIQSHPTAPEGEVKHLAYYTEREFLPGSIILCRNTAPLIGFAYALLQRDIPCRILGRDIGAQLAALVKKMRAVNLADLIPKLLTWRQRETDRAIADGRNPERIDDQYDCLAFFIQGLDEDSQTIPSLLAKIDLMFGDAFDTTNKQVKGEPIKWPTPGETRRNDTSNLVLLSTVHKAKGLEFPTVFILDRAKYMPSKYAKLPWQKRQEINLLYVAVTRAQERLIYITSNCWKEQND